IGKTSLHIGGGSYRFLIFVQFPNKRILEIRFRYIKYRPNRKRLSYVDQLLYPWTNISSSYLIINRLLSQVSNLSLISFSKRYSCISHLGKFAPARYERG